MANFKELDRIELSMEEMFKLFKWKDENKELVNNYKQVLPEGIIDVKGGLTIYFKFKDDRITYYESYDSDTLVVKLKTERLGGAYRILESWINSSILFVLKQLDNTFSEMDLITDTCTTVSSCMAYLENFKSEVIIRTESIRMSNTQRKRAEWHNRSINNQNKIIKLKKTVYSIPNGARYINPDKLPRKRHTESWSVRGHQRKTKTGKTVWVKPYIKGNGVRQPKIYKLEG